MCEIIVKHILLNCSKYDYFRDKCRLQNFASERLSYRANIPVIKIKFREFFSLNISSFSEI